MWSRNVHVKNVSIFNGTVPAPSRINWSYEYGACTCCCNAARRLELAGHTSTVPALAVAIKLIREVDVLLAIRVRVSYNFILGVFPFLNGMPCIAVPMQVMTV
jgi:hypothetical protein